MSLEGADFVWVKVEPQLDSAGEHEPLMSAQAGLPDLVVKAETASESEDACGVSGEVARPGLYFKHEVKVEAELESEESPCASTVADQISPSPNQEVKEKLVTGTKELQPSKLLLTCQGKLRREDWKDQPGIKSLNHTNTREKSYQCDRCNYVTTVKRHLKKHNMIHYREKPYKCDYCSYASVGKEYLRKHLILHGDPSYKCNYCSYASASKAEVTLHVKTHNGGKPFTCDQCSFASAYKSELKRHIMKHSGEKPYRCDQCSYATTRRSILKHHMITHTGDRPYKCEHCNYAFARKDVLKVHMIREHTTEKPFQCKQCSYATAVKSSLNNHMKTHTCI